jgi:hypothetical protein
VSCSLCETRKEKRFCPAVHGRICPQCCGEQREVTLDCPSDCVYLRQAREHEKPHPVNELDREALFPSVNIEESFLYQQENLLLGLSFALAKSARADRGLMDQDLIAALTALGKTYQTLVQSGLHYEASAPNLAQQVVMAEIRKMLEEFRQVEKQHKGHSSLRDSDIFKGIVFLTRMAHGRTSGRLKSRAFVDFIFQQFPEKTATADAAGSRIIVP